MTYPSYGACRDTSIHLFRHLTCLKLGRKKREGEERRREEDNKASLLALVFCSIVLTHMTMCQWARHIILHHFTPLWFPAHTCSCTQEQKDQALKSFFRLPAELRTKNAPTQKTRRKRSMANITSENSETNINRRVKKSKK